MTSNGADILAQKVHALLFSEGGALTYKQLARSLAVPEFEVRQALHALSKQLAGTGLALIQSDTEATLAIQHDAREVVVQRLKEEEEKNIGDAGLEILAVLLYEGPSTRSEIDYVRGVNSSSTIRTLLSRGLVERSGNPEDGREYIYRPTTELLAHLGVSGRENLPEYATLSAELKTFKQQKDNAGGTDTIE